MKTNMSVINDADDYRDVAVYIAVGEEEYRRMVSFDKEASTVYTSDNWAYAKDANAVFDDISAKDVPEAVLGEFWRVKPEAYTLAKAD